MKVSKACVDFDVVVIVRVGNVYGKQGIVDLQLIRHFLNKLFVVENLDLSKKLWKGKITHSQRLLVVIEVYSVAV